MARSARVELILDTLKAVRGAKDLSKATDDVADSLGKTAREGNKAARAVDETGDQMSQAARAAAGLDRQIDKLSGSLRQLAITQTLTGQNFSRQIRLEQAEVSRLTKNRKLLGDIGDNAGPGLGKSLISGITDAAAAVRPILLPALAGVAVAAAPFIGATIAGAVVGAAGIGGVAGGLILAAKDPRVQAAAKNLGDEVMRGLTTRAEVFIGPALQGVQKVRTAWHDFDADLTRIFNSSSGFVAPLIDGLLSGALKVGKGFANAVVSAKPVIDQLSRTFDELGGAVGDTFTTMGQHAEEGAMAIRDLTGATVGLIHGVNDVIGPLATVYGWLSKANGAFKEWTHGMSILDAINPIGPLKELGKGIKDVATGSDDSKKSVGEWHDGVVDATVAAEGLGTGAVSATHSVAAAGSAAAASAPQIKTFDQRMSDAAASTRAFSDAMHRAFSDQLSLDQATLQLANGAKTLRDELTHGRRELGLNSAEGRKNRGAILDQLSAIEALRQARFDETGSTQIATGEYNKNIRSLRAAALAAGFNKGEVDKLIGSYKKVPGKVNTVIGTPGLPQSDAGIKNYDKKLDALARTIKTNVTVTGDRIAYGKLQSLLIQQQALKKGISVSAATSAFNKNAGDGYGKGHANGGWTGPGSKYQPAGIVHAGEYVFDAQATSNLGVPRLDQMHKNAKTRGYANGGAVLNAPFLTTAAMTRIPSRAEALSAVTPAFGGGPTLDFIIGAVHAKFPGLGLISGYRPGARTLSGNVSYHALHRAADWPASRALAEYWNANYMARTKEFISPWNSLNILNGARHAYTGAIYRQHSGANAHDHIAMSGGGVLREPVFGYGMRSGNTYSLAEHGAERVLSARQTAAGGAGVTNNYVTVQAGYVVTPQQLENKIAQTVDNLKRKGRI